jgi:Skp family chaperone for outer membrane proteins
MQVLMVDDISQDSIQSFLIHDPCFGSMTAGAVPGTLARVRHFSAGGASADGSNQWLPYRGALTMILTVFCSRSCSDGCRTTAAPPSLKGELLLLIKGFVPAAMLASVLLLSGCQRAYYGALARIGIEKRDVLVRRVAAAQDSQQDAQQEFRSALEAFQSVIDFDGGELEDQYNTLAGAYDDASDQAEDVRDRIDAVERVGEALFDEWNDELDRYQDQGLRRRSEGQLRDTRRRFDAVVQAMNRAAERMDPVLAVLQDQVLYLKHNLNARAIASLEVERTNLENRVESLIVEMEKAIQEAESFIKAMDEGTA